MNKQAKQTKASLEEFAANHPLKKEQERVKRMEDALKRIESGYFTYGSAVKQIREIAREALKDE